MRSLRVLGIGLLLLTGCTDVVHQPKELGFRNTADGGLAVYAPTCPDWSGRPGIDHSNSVSSNFGCATAINLGLMVADPRDLVKGRAPGPQDGEAAAAAIANYHAAAATPPGAASGAPTPLTGGLGQGSAGQGAGGQGSGSQGAP